jgi:hypothetical protein
MTPPFCNKYHTLATNVVWVIAIYCHILKNIHTPILNINILKCSNNISQGFGIITEYLTLKNLN